MNGLYVYTNLTLKYVVLRMTTEEKRKLLHMKHLDSIN